MADRREALKGVMWRRVYSIVVKLCSDELSFGAMVEDGLVNGGFGVAQCKWSVTKVQRRARTWRTWEDKKKCLSLIAYRLTDLPAD